MLTFVRTGVKTPPRRGVTLRRSGGVRSKKPGLHASKRVTPRWKRDANGKKHSANTV